MIPFAGGGDESGGGGCMVVVGCGMLEFMENAQRDEQYTYMTNERLNKFWRVAVANNQL